MRTSTSTTLLLARTAASTARFSRILPTTAVTASLVGSQGNTTGTAANTATTAATSTVQAQTQHIRSFHTSQKREIVPLIGAALIIGAVRYSYKALQRMDAEWEDYTWELQQYDKHSNNAAAAASSLSVQTLAVDLGTVFTKIAKSSHPHAEIITTRQGDRAFFNGILYSSDGSQDDANHQRGRAALERFYFSKTDSDTAIDAGKERAVTRPWKLLQQGDEAAAVSTITDVLGPAVTEALERLDSSSTTTSSTTVPTLRHAITVPVQYIQSASTAYATAISKLATATTTTTKTTNTTTVTIPDPVAAVWGAQQQNLVAVDTDPRACQVLLVIDVGGCATQLSIVSKDVVQQSTSIDWGGETVVELLVGLLARESPQPLTDARSLSALQVQARTAVAELAGSSRVKVHVPYLFADPANHHLDTVVSRTVLEQEIERDIEQRLVGKLQALLENETVLSPHLPPPVDLQSLWMSVITQLLEQSKQTPMSVDHILLVGGGFKFPACLQSVEAALHTLAGADAAQKTIVPDPAMMTELTAVGAASMLAHYDYSVETGLHRMS